MKNSEGELVQKVEARSATPGNAPKWAPWPWLVDNGDSNAYGIFDANGNPIAYLSEKPSEGVGLRPEDPHHAHLIVHAPELYAALVRVLPMVRACKHEDFGDIHGNEDTKTDALRNAIAVLTKARGELESPSHH